MDENMDEVHSISHIYYEYPYSKNGMKYGSYMDCKQ